MPHRIHSVARVFLIATFTMLAASRSDADERAAGIPESLLARICNPDEPEDARLACELLWETAVAEDIADLLNHPHNVSLRAAWRRAILTADKARDTDRYFIPSPEAMHRFVGFMEGRIDVPLPEWWVDVILQAESFDGSRFTFPPDSVPYYPPSEAGIRGPEHVLLERSDAELSMTIDGITLPLPIASRESDCVSGIRVDDGLFVATHGYFPRPYTLWSLDGDGTERWRATVWAANEDVTYIGRCHQFVELVESAGTLYVFGATSGCVYVEAFDAESGNNVFRFSTSW